MSRASERVENGGFAGAGKRVLAVLRDAVVYDAFLWESRERAPFAQVAVTYMSVVSASRWKEERELGEPVD